ncbi:MAG: dihydropteroate synthase [Elusimicrobiota bacterium]
MSTQPAPGARIESLPVRGAHRPLIMGILNVTADSFYAASRRAGPAAAVEAGRRMAEEGADIIDIGGESTRPGAHPVTAQEELLRVLPVIEALAAAVRVPLSIDTSKAAVAERALDSGATMLNDVLALRGAGMPAVAVRYPRVVLMHMLGSGPQTMQDAPRYGDVVGDIADFFTQRLAAFRASGGEPERVWLDPGIGFGKNVEHNLEILARLSEFRRLGRPLLIGASRKSFIGKVLGSADAPAPAEQRLAGSLAAACRAAEAGAACVRVHDVAETRHALEIWARTGSRG